MRELVLGVPPHPDSLGREAASRLPDEAVAEAVDDDVEIAEELDIEAEDAAA